MSFTASTWNDPHENIDSNDNNNFSNGNNSLFPATSDLFQLTNNNGKSSNYFNEVPQFESGPPSYGDVMKFGSFDPVKSSSEDSSFEVDVPTVVAGSIVNSIQKDATSYVNENRLLQAEQGTGPNGHAFDAVAHARQENTLADKFSDIKSAEILGGSALGPEGLVAGIGLAAVTTIAQNFISSNENTTQATDGSFVNAVND